MLLYFMFRIVSLGETGYTAVKLNINRTLVNNVWLPGFVFYCWWGVWGLFLFVKFSNFLFNLSFDKWLFFELFKAVFSNYKFFVLLCLIFYFIFYFLWAKFSSCNFNNFGLWGSSGEDKFNLLFGAV